MERLKRLWKSIRSVRPRTLLLVGGAVVVLLFLFIGGLYAWDYTNSPPFCGTTCHTMPPHYESYLRSPHARVACVECHIGRTSFGIQFTRKAVDAQFVWAYLTQQYQYPLYAKGLQPARESCEKCHWPEKFSWDKVITLREFNADSQNTPQDTTLVMKIGGGTQREGLGLGIHWHIENQIDFAYTDDQQQQIPWIRVTKSDGTQTVYSDIENPLTPEQLAKLPTRRMDCIDCHNRVSHSFSSPNDALDSVLKTNAVDPTIPEIKQKGVDALTPLYKTTAEANAAIGNLEEYYKQTFPDYYQQNTAKVQDAVKQLQALYPQLHHPDQGLDWTTHANNLGHKDWPGCFRCHDGKHFTQDRTEAIRLECNLCHSIPAVKKQGQSATAISLERIQEPDTHKTTTWLIEHRSKFDATCQQCHDTRNAGGSDNSSFCSNSACHGNKWTYAGFDAPALSQILKPPIKTPPDPNASPAKIPHPIGGNPDCQICHGANSKIRPMPADHEGRTNDLCLACHTPTIPPEENANAGKPPSIPHDLTGRAECLGCHGTGTASLPQVPDSHKKLNFNNGQCTICHQPSKQGETSSGTGSVPKIPPDHYTAGCAACHSTGASNAPVFPASHAAYTNDQCANCHSSSTQGTPGSQGPTPSSSGGLPKIPPDHYTAGCTACHATGASNAPVFPASHAAYTNDQCVNCHTQATAGGETTPTATPAANATAAPAANATVTPASGTEPTETPAGATPTAQPQ